MGSLADALVTDPAALTDALANPIVSSLGALLHVWNGATWDRIRSGVPDNLGGAGLLQNGNMLWNGAAWDRSRNNNEVTVLASAARTATNQSADLVNYNARGVIVVADFTAVPGVDTVTVVIRGKDTLSGKYYTLLSSIANVAVSTVALTVYPGVTVAANVAASSPLPRIWRVEFNHSAGTSFTYSASANYIN